MLIVYKNIYEDIMILNKALCIKKKPYIFMKCPLSKSTYYKVITKIAKKPPS